LISCSYKNFGWSTLVIDIEKSIFNLDLDFMLLQEFIMVENKHILDYEFIMVENKHILDYEDITRIFGLRSSLFRLAMQYIEKKSVSKEEKFKKKFLKWQSAFKDIYGDAADKNLFIRHTYFASILKIIVVIKLSLIQNYDMEDAYEDAASNNLGALQIEEIQYYDWTNLNLKLFKIIYSIIEDIRFARQDLFYELYQELIFSVTRHKIGEFYTPHKLVQKMVKEQYEFGQKVLDPSCGSGSFLIEVIVDILNSKKPASLKSIAINNVIGFDINPLATLTAKVNIFLLFLDTFELGVDSIPGIKVYLFDSLFPQKFEDALMFDLKELYESFDLILGNPPWLTYKDLTSREYQKVVRNLAEELEIKPTSQYITHIELGSVFFYAIPRRFLKVGGKIFFVITKSVLNGDHCNKFRLFKPFQNLAIWDFPNYYFFKVDHICLKADYIGFDNETKVEDKYPIKTKLFNDDLELQKELNYSSLKIENDGARAILPDVELKALENLKTSEYKSLFFQGATLVPRPLVFFQVEEKNDETLVISSDSDIMRRSKKKWRYYFQNKEIEQKFRYKTFLNKDLVPFFLKGDRNVFLPVNEQFQYDENSLKANPKAFQFYTEMNNIYKDRKKETSKIETLFDNLNYWNKLLKQTKNKHYMVVYNASGSNLKAAVIHNRKRKLIVGSENYYYSTDSKDEAYYLAAILNTPVFTRNVKLIRSSRHIHKRPFSFPIPLFDDKNATHISLAKKAVKCETIVQDLFFKNPNINADKVKIFINQKLQRINKIVEQIVFN